MSKFSGKCDFCDHLWIGNNTEEEIMENIKTYTVKIYGKDHRDHTLAMNSIIDVIKYYPYLVATASWSKDESHVILSGESFIDSEERERISWKFDDIMKYYKKCKRKKEEFTVEKCTEAMWWMHDYDRVGAEIARRVEKYGNKATLDGIHTNIHEHYRREWYKELVAHQCNQWEAFNWCFNTFFATEEEMNKRLKED